MAELTIQESSFDALVSELHSVGSAFRTTAWYMPGWEEADIEAKMSVSNEIRIGSDDGIAESTYDKDAFSHLTNLCYS